MSVGPHDLFNRKLLDFIADLKPIIGTLPEYGVASASAKLMSQVDEKKNQQFFDRYVASFEPSILSRDESFFLRRDFDAGVGQEGVGVVQLLQGVWGGLSAEEKDAVWSHLQVLLVLNRRCKS